MQNHIKTIFSDALKCVWCGSEESDGVFPKTIASMTAKDVFAHASTTCHGKNAFFVQGLQSLLLMIPPPRCPREELKVENVSKIHVTAE